MSHFKGTGSRGGGWDFWVNSQARTLSPVLLTWTALYFLLEKTLKKERLGEKVAKTTYSSVKKEIYYFDIPYCYPL